MILTMVRHRHRQIVLASVYFPHTGYSDIHVEKMYRCVEIHRIKRHTTIIAGDLTRRWVLAKNKSAITKEDPPTERRTKEEPGWNNG